MAESLKIIHVCDHVLKYTEEEDGKTLLQRQEIREDENIEANDDRLIYSENWEYIEEDENNKYYKTQTVGSNVSMHFYGDNICIYGRKSLDGGKARVMLDGVNYGVVDLYNSNLVKKEPLLMVEDLPYGMHTAYIELLQDSNSLSKGNVLMIEGAMIQDAFIIENSPYEIIPGSGIVQNIKSVYQDIDGVLKVYTQGLDYVLFGNNKIKWISVNRPNPDYKYTVEYTKKVTYSKAYTKTTCQRCYGLGWYGAFNNLTSGLPSKSTGVQKIAEDIIKILLTPLRDDGYGSEFQEMNKYLYTSEELVEETATSEINRIERYYKSMQAEEIAKGAIYTPEDTLYAIIIDNVSFEQGSSTLNLVITVYNNVGQSQEAELNI